MTLALVVVVLLNGVLALITLRLSRRGWAAGLAAGFGVLVIYLAVLMLWPDAGNRHSRSEQLLVYSALAGVTWVPAATLSLVAGRLRGWPSLWAGIAAISVALGLGVAYPYTALALFCANWGECP